MIDPYFFGQPDEPLSRYGRSMCIYKDAVYEEGFAQEELNDFLVGAGTSVWPSVTTASSGVLMRSIQLVPHSTLSTICTGMLGSSTVP